MQQLKVNGMVEILGKEVNIIEGGFGEGKKCLTDKQISEIHGMEIKHIRELINRNVKRFKVDIDLIDLKVVAENDNNLLNELMYSKMQVSKANNIYLLSERGYAKLIKIMDSDKAWEVHDKLMEEYFTMREVINSDEQLKAMALLKITQTSNHVEQMLAVKEYMQLETKPLHIKIDKLEDENAKILKFIARDSGFVTKKDLADRLDTNTQRVCRVLKHLGVYTKIKNEISQVFKDKYRDVKLTQLIPKSDGTTNYGVDWQYTAEGSVIVVKELLGRGYVYETNNGAYKMVNLDKIKELENK